MKIVGSELTLGATHVAVERREVQERLRAWSGARPGVDARAAAATRSPAAEVSLSPEARQKASQAAATDDASTAVDADPKLALLKAILARVFGVEVSIADLRDLTAPPPDAAVATAEGGASEGSGAPPAAGYGVEYERHEVRTEQEQTSFTASGTVRTSDGQSISFSVAMQVARSRTERLDVSVRLGDAARRQDPLVVNFAGTAAQLSDQTFSIDLNGDGNADTAHFVASGSGFLVFDRNGDGKITQASELFGPQSGDGFAELARLDQDGNGWIDEGDGMFGELQVWTRDANGADHLQSLQDLGVGALSTARLATPFELQDANGNAQGAVRSTGVYLKESGEAGTLQQIDLVV